jgi:type IV pilus assembly protein PilC
VFRISRNIGSFWVGAGLVIGGLLVINWMLSASPQGRRFRETLFLNLPVFGSLYRSSVLSKMSEAMAMMVAAGSDMPTCLRLSASASGSERVLRESDIVASHVEQGTNIIEAGQHCSMIPRFFLYSVQLGSQRNELQDNLRSLGDMYAQQVRCTQARLETTLLPVMIVFVGFFVMLCVMAMFLPMIQIISGLSA